MSAHVSRRLAARALAFAAGAAAAVLASSLFTACDCFEEDEVIPVPEGTYGLAEPADVSDYQLTYTAATQEVRVTFAKPSAYRTEPVRHAYVYEVVRAE